MKNKKLILILTAAIIMSLFLSGCGKSEEKFSSFENSEALLNAVFGNYTEDTMFPVAGGDSENQTMDSPGAFNVALADELETVTRFPADKAEELADGATMVHLMNANIFTASVLNTKDGNTAELAEAYKTAVENTQWMCGIPEVFVVMEKDGFLISAFGDGEMVETFKSNTEKACGSVEILVEENISDNL